MITVLPRQSSWRRVWWMHPELSLAAVAAAAWLAVLTVHIATGPFHTVVQHSTLMPDQGMAGHHHGTSNPGIAAHQSVTSGPGSAPTFLLSFGLWVLMATAMMLPTALPAARFDFAEREVETSTTRAGTVRRWLPRRMVGCRRPPAVRGLVDRAESYWAVGYFRGIGHCGGVGVDALEATVSACLSSFAVVASRRVES